MDRILVLPAVAYAERARQLHLAGRPIEEFDRFLAKSSIEVEPLSRRHAVAYTQRIPDQAWKQLSRDAFIAGHLGRGDVLWTTNARDFARLGVPPEQIRDCADHDA